MVFSVYDYGTKRYSYYDDGKPSETHAGAPAVISLGGIGESPDRAAWRLPVGATKIGEGDMPRGRIASLGSFQSSTPKILLLLGAAYLGWRYLR